MNIYTTVFLEIDWLFDLPYTSYSGFLNTYIRSDLGSL